MLIFKFANATQNINLIIMKNYSLLKSFLTKKFYLQSLAHLVARANFLIFYFHNSIAKNWFYHCVIVFLVKLSNLYFLSYLAVAFLKSTAFLLYVDILTGENFALIQLAIIDLIYWSIYSVGGEGVDVGYRYLSQLRVLLYENTWKSGATSK